MIKEGLLPEYDHEIATTRRLLERMPGDQLSWKPHAKSKSLGGLATHLVQLPLWTDTILNEPFFDIDTLIQLPDKASRAEIVEAFDASARRARGWMDRTDAEYLSPWSLRRGAHEVFSIPRVAALRSFVISHLVHHRGQLSVYLRLLDVPLPAIYGPTADEG